MPLLITSSLSTVDASRKASSDADEHLTAMHVIFLLLAAPTGCYRFTYVH